MEHAGGDSAMDGVQYPTLYPAPACDFLYDPTLTDHLFLAIASQPIGDSTPEEWVAAQAAEECGSQPSRSPWTEPAG